MVPGTTGAALVTTGAPLSVLLCRFALVAAVRIEHQATDEIVELESLRQRAIPMQTASRAFLRRGIRWAKVFAAAASAGSRTD
jgi:hypothetical protein